MICDADARQAELTGLTQETEYLVTVTASSCLGDSAQGEAKVFVTPSANPIPRVRIAQYVQMLKEAESAACDFSSATQAASGLLAIAVTSGKHAFAVAKLGAVGGAVHLAQVGVNHPECLEASGCLLQALCVNSLCGLEALRGDEESVDVLNEMLSSPSREFSDTCRESLARYYEHILAFPYLTHPTPYLKK